MSITKTLIDPAVSYVNSKWATSSKTSGKIYARAANLLLAPATLITHALDTIIGLGATLGVVCTLGRQADIVDHAANFIDYSHKLLASPYMQLLKTIDPKQKAYEKIDRHNNNADMGLLREKIAFIFNHALELSKSESFFSRHIASRLCFALSAVAFVITRAVDGVIGVIAATFSLLTLGHFHELNKIAYQGLHTTGIIADLFSCTLGILNPHAY